MKFLSGKKYLNLVTAFILLAMVGLFLKNIWEVRFIQDDAYTSFRYVKNFVNGDGLVFNPGERVEGYTNFLWVILLSLPMFLNKLFPLGLKIENIAQILSITFSCVAIIETYYLSRIVVLHDSGRGSAASNIVVKLENLVPPFLMVYSVPLLYWGVSAMETSLFVSLSLLSIIVYLKNLSSGKPNKIFIAVSVLNSLLRPEGTFCFGMIMLHQFLTSFLSPNDKTFSDRFRSSLDKKLLTEISFYSIPIIIYVCFRLIYYGYPLPNTYYAKTEFTAAFITRGWNYFWNFAKSNLLFGTLLFLPLVLLGLRELRSKISLLYGFTICWIVAIVIIGGDVLPIQRFFLPVMPIIFILITKSVSHLIHKAVIKSKVFRNLSRLVCFSAIVTWGIFVYNNQYPEMLIKRAYESGLVSKMKVYASWVKHQMEINNRKMKVAMSTIGAFSFYSDAHVIDLVGLTDSYVAHHPLEVNGIDDELPVLWKERHYNAQYVLSEKPDYIIFPAGAKPTAFAECAIFVQPEFKEKYYAQIFYSDYFHQLMPIFTLRNSNAAHTDATGRKCHIDFLKHYINAENIFLRMIESDNSKLLKDVLTECDSISYFCPSRKYDALTIGGYALYHAGKMDEAEKYLFAAAQGDPDNSIARFYLKDIYVKNGEVPQAVKVMMEIKKLSPDALPYFSPSGTDYYGL